MTDLHITQQPSYLGRWLGDPESILTDPDLISQRLQDISQNLVLLDFQGRIAAGLEGMVVKGANEEEGFPILAEIAAISPSQFGDPAFLRSYGLKAAYMAGSMANAISGIDLVTALGRGGYLASYGAGGISPTRLEEAILEIQTKLPEGPYAFNLIHSPQEPALERKAAELYLKHQVRTIEASAYLRLTPAVVLYRAAGLQEDPTGAILAANRIIAKVSRPEVAVQFLNPPPPKILDGLVEEGKITQRQAELARHIPMADDITVEADSGGHTDNRPLMGMLPAIMALRDEVQAGLAYPTPVRIGAAGGIGTPAALLGAFSMGAAYVVTGSINQACLEAGTSPAVKQALSEAGPADVMMAPSADMFEMGVKVQVLKRGTMFPMRAQKLYETYLAYGSAEDIEPSIKEDLESKIFQRDLESIWDECVQFFSERDPEQLEKARQDPKKKMALIFRWYLGLATHWGIQGLPERRLDYQIWCGPAMGSFNEWARGSDLEPVENRSAVVLADRLLYGAASLQRLNQLRLQGISLPSSWT